MWTVSPRQPEELVLGPPQVLEPLMQGGAFPSSCAYPSEYVRPLWVTCTPNAVRMTAVLFETRFQSTAEV